MLQVQGIIVSLILHIHETLKWDLGPTRRGHGDESPFLTTFIQIANHVERDSQQGWYGHSRC